MNEEQVACSLSEIKNDMKWIKQSIEKMDKKFANKWTEKAIGFVMVGVFGWVISQLLGIIGSVYAIIN